MLKNEIIEQLSNEMADAQAHYTTNSAKAIKACKFTQKLVQEWFNSTIDYEVRPTPKGNLNKGDIVEIAISIALGNENKHMIAGRNQKDLIKQRKFYECKALINPSNLPYLNNYLKMKDDEGFLIILLDGVYKLRVKELKAHKDLIKIKSDGKFRITASAVKKIAHYDKDLSVLLGI